MMMMQQPMAQNVTPTRHQYSELLVTTTDSSDGSVTYTLPVYPGSDGTTYSTTSAIYHQPNCQCHMMACQPAVCQSPAHQSDQTDTSATCSDTTNSTSKQTWVHVNDDGLPSRRWKKPVGWIWAGLTLFIFLVCILCLTQPSWLVNSETGESLGLLKQNKIDTVTNEFKVTAYTELSHLGLPSTSWKIALVLYSISTTLLGLSTLLAFGAILLTVTKTRDHVTFCSGYVQLFAVILLTTSALFYMVGLDTPTAKDVCHTSSVFYIGDCDIGWSYLLLVISTALGFLLPVLSHYIDHNLCTAVTKETMTLAT